MNKYAKIYVAGHRGLVGSAIVKKLGEKVIIFFDEPILSALVTPAYIGIQDEEVIQYLNEVIHPIQTMDVAVGIHCCGNMDWGLLAQTSVDIIS